MIELVAKQTAEGLVARGIDPSAFLSDGIDAAYEVCGTDHARALEVLKQLEHFAIQLASQGLGQWTPFHFGVRGIAEISKNDPIGFASLLADLSQLISALAAAGIDLDLSIQQGVTAACATGEPELVGSLLRASTRIAKRKLDPKELLRHASPAIGAAAAHDPAKLAVVLDAVESFVLSIASNGVGPYWPIFVGVAAMGEAYAGDPTGFVGALRELASLIASLELAEISPYPIVEHGVTHAFHAAAGTPWLRDEVLPFASAIAASGQSPQEALLGGIRVIATLAEPSAKSVWSIAEVAAGEGVDPSPALHSLLPVITQFDLDTIERLTRDAIALLGEMKARGIRTRLAFDDGFAHLPSSDEVIEVALRIARALVEHGRDPGPTLKFGVVKAAGALAAADGLRRAMFATAERQAIDGIDPWGLLEWGMPTIVDASGDEDAQIDLLERLDALVRSLFELGADARDILLYTVYQPARAMDHDRAQVFGLVDRLALAMRVLLDHGIDPRGAMVLGIPAVAEKAPRVLSSAFRLIEAAAARKLDPEALLTIALPALASATDVDPLIDRMLAAIDRLRAEGRSIEVVALARAIEAISSAGPRAIDPSLQAIIRAAPARDLSPMLAKIVPMLAVDDEVAFVGALEVAERVLMEAGPELELAGLDSAARVARSRPDVLERVLRSWLSIAGAPYPLLLFGGPAAAEIADGDPELFDRALATFVVRTKKSAVELRPMFRACLSTIARWSVRDMPAFVGLLECAIQIAESEGEALDHLLEHALPVATKSAETRHQYQRALEEVALIRTSGVVRGVERETWQAVGHLRAIVESRPAAWSDLIVPTIRALGPGAPAALWGYARLGAWMNDDDALALLRTVATQEGVRAPDLIQGFLLPALQSGAIRSLGEERDEILAFLRDVPIAAAEHYRRYREICRHDRLSLAEKQAQIDALNAGLRALVAAIVSGEVGPHIANDPLFADALYYVFPAAYTVGKQHYGRLAGEFPDHQDHTRALAPLTQSSVELPTGAYRVRDGETIDLTPWQVLLRAIASVHAGEQAPIEFFGQPVELPELGELLLGAWIEGKIGRVEIKEDILARIYRHHRSTRRELPDDLVDAGHLLAHREFLADTAKEIIQDALFAVRVADPEAYRDRVATKLSRRARVGKGLVRAVWRTVLAHREGTIDAETAIDRLGRQLKGFDLSSEPVRLELLATDLEELEPLLRRLERTAQPIELGDEHLRVLGDLVGAELAAMQRELFGTSGEAGKLEYRRMEGGRTVRVRFQVTKRNAHAPIGYCEGVCTAPDRRLWDDPNFLQVILWGDDDRAMGGFHLFIVESEGERMLALPGINPSLRLLADVGADALLDAIFDFAHHAASRWDLTAVLVPVHRGIATNRGPIREVLDAGAHPERILPAVTFSHSPYAYAFDRVYVIER